MKRVVRCCFAVALVSAIAGPVRADEVTDWNEAMFRAALIAGTSPLNMSRFSAMVQAAVFDAVNGIDQRYTPIYVAPAAPPGSSRRAAAVQAAYAMLSKLYGAVPPTTANQQAALDARRAASLLEIAQDESQSSIDKGLAWGQTVANQIFTIRSTDGFSTTAPFPDNLAIGEWRRTPNLPLLTNLTTTTLSAPGVGYIQFSTQTPWVMTSFSQFRAPAHTPLSSPQYARDFNETKTMGSLTSSARTPDQTTNAFFWNAGTASYLWNHVALSLIEKNHRDRDRDEDWNHGHHSNLLENARIFATLDVAMADAAIGCWDSKYVEHFWRPITAINDTGDDGNPATTSEPNWMPLLITPGHPEYPSGHSCVSGAAAAILSHEFGESTHFTMTSDAMLGVERHFGSFSEALESVKEARVFAGIHFRTATEEGAKLGAKVAELVLQERFQPIH
jgi:PAP2 superfamily